MERTGPERFPYDRHGFGLLGDVALLGVLALPLATLLWWIVQRYHAGAKRVRACIHAGAS